MKRRPLRSSKDEKYLADAIKGYALFDRYSSVEAQIKQAAVAEDEKKHFVSLRRNTIISVPRKMIRKRGKRS